jgi:myo-inositol 2-dehydrogenase / D-chiro-inositol 1-dehydrogenase
MKDTKQSDNRRDFLRDSSLMLATAIPAGLTSAAHCLAGAYEPRSAERRIGLVGCGKRGIQVAMGALAASDSCRVVAMADAFGDRVQQAARALKGKFPERFEVPPEHRFVGPGVVQRLCETDVDAVILAAPPRLLPAMVESAVQARKHVFVEMPIAIDLVGVKQFVAAGELAREHGTALVVGLQRRASGDYIETIERLRDGAIGRLLHGQIHCNVPTRTLGERGKHQTLVEHKLRNWRCFEEFSGGTLLGELVHNLDVFNWLLGAHPWLAEAADVERYLSTSSGTESRHAEWSRIGSANPKSTCIEFQYRNGFRLFTQMEMSDQPYRSAEWVYGTDGYCEISRGFIHNTRLGTIWRCDQPRDGLASSIGGLLQAAGHQAPQNDTLRAADSTLAALLARQATISRERVRWADLQHRDRLNQV